MSVKFRSTFRLFIDIFCVFVYSLQRSWEREYGARLFVAFEAVLGLLRNDNRFKKVRLFLYVSVVCSV